MMRVGRPLLAAFLFAASALVACDSDDSTPSAAPEPFGAARVEPSSAAIGETFSIEPAGEVQPLCMNVLTVLQETQSGDLEREAWLSPDGYWQQFGQEPEPTVASCLPEPSAAARTFTVSEQMESGSNVVCMRAELSETGCGRITVTG